MKVVIWGGLGRLLVFVNCYGVDVERFFIVVDFDVFKGGMFVLGIG